MALEGGEAGAGKPSVEPKLYIDDSTLSGNSVVLVQETKIKSLHEEC